MEVPLYTKSCKHYTKSCKHYIPKIVGLYSKIITVDVLSLINSTRGLCTFKVLFKLTLKWHY